MVDKKLLSKIKQELRDYLTFYHEYHIPRNHFFDLKTNQRQEKLLVVSSPSRMGNHLLMSVLDNHPSLPRIPGEDGLLAFTFLTCNYDIKSYLENLKSENCVEYLMNLSTNYGGAKWKKVKQLFHSKANISTQTVSGIKLNNHSSILDYKDLIFDIDYNSYFFFLKENRQDIQYASTFNEVYLTYLEAMKKLDFTKKDANQSFDFYNVYGGMRTQLLWICQTFKNAKILCSLRSFDTYAISQIKSRNPNSEITDDLIQIAWEHWYHKVMDIIYLKINYPERIGIVMFEDLIGNSTNTHKSICNFLGITYANSMASGTLFGNMVTNNSWNEQLDRKKGTYYKPTIVLAKDKIPASYYFISEQLEQLKIY